MNSIEQIIERLLFWGRWTLVPMYLGMIVILLFFTVKFFQELLHLLPMLLTMEETTLVLTGLALVDLVLVGNLLVMVVLSGYESFVSRLDVGGEEKALAWLGKVDAGTLKIKLAVSIIAISSIHLLKAFVEAQSIPNDKLGMLVGMHLTFLVSALILAFVDKIAFSGHRDH